MNVPMGYGVLRRSGGRATVRELAAWCDAPRDPSDAEAEGYSRRGLIAMMGQLDTLGAKQISPGTLDAVVEIQVSEGMRQ